MRSPHKSEERRRLAKPAGRGGGGGEGAASEEEEDEVEDFVGHTFGTRSRNEEDRLQIS